MTKLQLGPGGPLAQLTQEEIEHKLETGEWNLEIVRAMADQQLATQNNADAVVANTDAVVANTDAVVANTDRDRRITLSRVPSQSEPGANGFAFRRDSINLKQ